MEPLTLTGGTISNPYNLFTQMNHILCPGKSKKKTGAQEKDKDNTTFNRGGIGNGKRNRKKKKKNNKRDAKNSSYRFVLDSTKLCRESQGRNQ